MKESRAKSCAAHAGPLHIATEGDKLCVERLGMRCVCATCCGFVLEFENSSPSTKR